MYFLYKKFYLLYRIYYNFLFLKTKNKKCIEKDNKQVSDKIQLENHFSFQNNTLQNLYTQGSTKQAPSKNKTTLIPIVLTQKPNAMFK